MRCLVRYTYANPELLRDGVNENGAYVKEREPGHPTRPARPWELNTWEEEVTDEQAKSIALAGGTVRIVGGAYSMLVSPEGTTLTREFVVRFA